jgi:hypothetical protein
MRNLLKSISHGILMSGSAENAVLAGCESGNSPDWATGRALQWTSGALRETLRKEEEPSCPAMAATAACSSKEAPCPASLVASRRCSSLSVSSSRSRSSPRSMAGREKCKEAVPVPLWKSSPWGGEALHTFSLEPGAALIRTAQPLHRLRRRPLLRLIQRLEAITAAGSIRTDEGVVFSADLASALKDRVTMRCSGLIECT